MKIALAGKGGVGKTTLTSLLAHHFAANGRHVLAIDGDPSPCLGPALGFSDQQLADLRPIGEMRELIAERTGSDPKKSAGGFFKLNPKVSDLPDRFSISQGNIEMLMLGAVEQGGSGCICPSSALLKQLVNHVIVQRDGVVLLDLYAGVEHLGRGTAESVDALLVVAEPTKRSMGTARQVESLAKDLGIENIYLVGNKAQSKADEAFFREVGEGFNLVGCMPSTPEVRVADRSGDVLFELSVEMAAVTAEIASRIDRNIPEGAGRSVSPNDSQVAM